MLEEGLKMKVAVIDNDKILVKKVEDINFGGKKGAIVKVLGCGLCGSDIVKFREKQIIEIYSDTVFKKGDLIVK